MEVSVPKELEGTVFSIVDLLKMLRKEVILTLMRKLGWTIKYKNQVSAKEEG